MIAMIHSRIPRALTLVGTLVLGACASSPPIDPTGLEMARSAIEQAKQLGSEQHAHQMLREAEERLMLARARAEDGAPEEASRMLVEARVLAQRAAAESLAKQAVQAAQAVQRSLTALESALGVDLPDNE